MYLSYDGTFCNQLDSAAIGLPLVLVIANIHVDSFEQQTHKWYLANDC